MHYMIGVLTPDPPDPKAVAALLAPYNEESMDREAYERRAKDRTTYDYYQPIDYWYLYPTKARDFPERLWEQGWEFRVPYGLILPEIGWVNRKTPIDEIDLDAYYRGEYPDFFRSPRYAERGAALYAEWEAYATRILTEALPEYYALLVDIHR